jgi:hypothetical protein
MQAWIIVERKQTGLLEIGNRQDCWREGRDRIVGEKEET